jgi:hypothetical protein
MSAVSRHDVTTVLKQYCVQDVSAGIPVLLGENKERKQHCIVAV